MRVSVELTLPRDSRFVAVTRNVAGCILRDLHAPQRAAEDVKLALSEACANVLRHGAGAQDYSVSLSVDETGCQMEVADLGSGSVADSFRGARPSTESEHGRGLYLMRAVVDDLEFLPDNDATRVRLIKRWPAMTFDLGLRAAAPQRPGG